MPISPAPDKAAPAAFTDLQVAYDSNIVLHGITATIAKGSCVAITGSNGSGKSTLLKALLGVAPVVGGSAELFGTEVSPKAKIDWQKVGYVPQRITVGGGIGSTVREVVETGLLGPRRWWLPSGAKKRVDQILTEVGLLHRDREAFQVLSGGQQQRALIARALVREPELLILDEPLTGLDEHNREVLARLIGDHLQKGNTAIIVLHELGILAPLIDRELRISSGHIVHDGPCTHHVHETDDHHHLPDHAPAPLLSLDPDAS